ncbi:hypothetical protein [Foetidibacter luteolus]|uniref:hypothetical protein n=1 Tax=Foetidibacter luteolus TaxID=2608880 RepID=UPI00129A9A81|nr:hypothetical protein [Foetidibacter luteolus]
MTEKDFIDVVESTNWKAFRGPEYFNPDSVAPALSSLIHLRQDNDKWKVYNNVLFAIGNNHGGTYYPAVLSALPLLVRLLKTTENEVTRNCIFEIFSEWYYSFDPEIGTYKLMTEIQLESYVRTNIKSCIAGNVWNESERNMILIADFLNYFNEEAST